MGFGAWENLRSPTPPNFPPEHEEPSDWRIKLGAGAVLIYPCVSLEAENVCGLETSAARMLLGA